MRKSNILFSLSFCLIIILPLNAAEKDSTNVKKSEWTAAIRYSSNNVYLGRIDSANIMYLTPSISYHHKSGLHAGASVSYQPGSGINRIDAASVEAGYDFSIGEHFNGELGVAKYFYDMNSLSLASVNNLGATSSFSYDFPFITVNALVGLSFNEKTDVITGAGISKSFDINDISIAPSFKFNAGTQNYYNTFLKNGKSHLNGNKGHGKGKSSTKKTVADPTASYSVQEASQFKILDYELSAPLSYSIKHFGFEVVPTYFIPVNAATIESSDGTLQKENLINRFVVEVGVSYKF